MLKNCRYPALKGTNMKQFNLLIIGDPFARSGGGTRCFEVIKRYKDFGVSPILVVPPFNNEAFRLDSSLSVLLRNGVKIVGLELSRRYAQRRKGYIHEHEQTSLLSYGSLSFFASRFSEEICSLLRDIKIDLVVGHHELWDVVQTTHQIAKNLSLKSAAILQLPPFYEKSRKVSELDMLTSLNTWQLSKNHPLFTHYESISPTLRRKIVSILHTTMIARAQSDYYKLTISNNLSGIDEVFAVSKSVPFEMGHSWVNKIAILKPAVAIGQDWNQTTEKRKEDYVLYYARLIPEKGILEVPLIWKEFLKCSPKNVKLYVVGAFKDKRVENAFYGLIDKLGLKNKIICLGYVERKRLTNLVAHASAVVYPSHLDAMPLVVLECLSLGTPVVSYDIPSITLNYSNIAAVNIVPEYDVDAMAHKLVELIQSEDVFSGVQQPTWNQVTENELLSLQKLVTL